MVGQTPLLEEKSETLGQVMDEKQMIQFPSTAAITSISAALRRAPFPVRPSQGSRDQTFSAYGNSGLQNAFLWMARATRTTCADSTTARATSCAPRSTRSASSRCRPAITRLNSAPPPEPWSAPSPAAEPTPSTARPTTSCATTSSTPPISSPARGEATARAEPVRRLHRSARYEQIVPGSSAPTKARTSAAKSPA